MVAGGRHSLAQVARELDLRPEMLRRWKRQARQRGCTHCLVRRLTPREEEGSALRPSCR